MHGAAFFCLGAGRGRRKNFGVGRAGAGSKISVLEFAIVKCNGFCFNVSFCGGWITGQEPWTHFLSGKRAKSFYYDLPFCLWWSGVPGFLLHEDVQLFNSLQSRSWVSLKLCNTLSVMLCVRNGQGSAGPSCASVGELLTVTEPAFFWVTAATKPSSYSHQSHHTHTRISPISHTHSFTLKLIQKRQNIIVTCQFHPKHSSNLIWLSWKGLHYSGSFWQ